MTLTQQQKIDRLIHTLKTLANEMFNEGDPIDKEIYGLLFKLHSLKAA